METIIKDFICELLMWKFESLCLIDIAWHSFAPPHCKTSQYRRIFVPLSVSLRNDLSDPVFDGVGLAGFKSRANAFLLAWSALSFLSPTILFDFSFHGLVVWGWGLLTDSVLTLSRLAQRTPNNNDLRNMRSITSEDFKLDLY